MKYIILLLLALLCFSCKEEKEEVPEKQAIVRVGSSTLIEKDLINILGTDASNDQKLNYIRRWSDKELAYHAALENGIDKEEAVKHTIESMKKEFLSVQYIQREIEKFNAVEVSADEIQNEFRDNLHLYLRKEPVMRVAKIVIDSQQSGWRARDGLTVENFRERGNAYSSVQIPPFEEIKYAPKSDFNQETWDIIFYLRVGAITLPIKEDGLYSIYLILAKENAGSQLLLEDVIDDVRRNVLNKKQSNIFENIYRELRNSKNYYYDSEYIANLEKDTSTAAVTQKEN